jgi:hypothetical protein
MVKENKSAFIIVRVTTTEKAQLRKTAAKNRTRFSVFVRNLLGFK